MILFNLIFIFLCIYGIRDLIDERKSVSYKIKKVNESEYKRENYEKLICVKLKDVIFDFYDSGEKEVELSLLHNDVLQHSLNEVRQSYRYDDNLYTSMLKDISRTIKEKKYYLFDNSLCLISDIVDQTLISRFKDFNLLTLEKVFEKSRFIKGLKHCIFEKNIGHFYKFEGYYGGLSKSPDYLNADKFFKSLIILKKPSPYSDCIEYDEDQPNKEYSKLFCINRCAKTKYNLSEYFYLANETGSIIINYLKNSSIETHERSCLQKCSKNECKLIRITRKKGDQESFTIFEAYPLISEFQFYIQLVGLTLSFFSISVYQVLLLFKVPKKLSEKNCIILIIKLSFWTICLISFLNLSFTSLKNYDYNAKNSVRKQMKMPLLEKEDLDLISCKEINRFAEKKLKSILKIKDQTYSELEKNEMAKYLVNNVQFKLMNQNLNISFRNTKETYRVFNENEGILYRCFRYELELEEQRYQSIYLNSHLKTSRSNRLYKLYILSRDQEFNSKSIRAGHFEKIIIKKESKSETKETCENYNKNLNCSTRQTCVDQCVIRTFFKNYSVALNFVTDYNNLDAEKFCQSIFRQPCYESNFEKKLMSLIGKEIDLYYDVTNIYEETSSSFLSFAFEIQNIQGIIFGLNILNALKLLLIWLFRLNANLKTNGFHFLLIYFICVVGCLANFFLIYYQIIHEKLVQSMFYEAPDIIRTNDLVFCLDEKFNETCNYMFDTCSNYNENCKEFANQCKNFNETNENWKAEDERLDGHYLERKTSNISIDNILVRLDYLNRSNQWTSLNQSTGFINDDIKVEEFFIFNKKCFIIKPNLEYSKNPFTFEGSLEIVRIFFNSNFIGPFHKVSFATKRRDSMQLSKMFALYFYGAFTNHIYQEMLDIEYDDRFLLIKDPVSFFYYFLWEENYLNDFDKYTEKLIRNFKKEYNMTTLNLPLRKENFDYKIEDETFVKFYREKQNITENQMPKSPNFRKQLDMNTGIEYVKFDGEPDFKFSLFRFKKVITITNAESWSKKILTILNSVDLWLSIKLFDLFNLKYRLFFSSTQPIRYASFAMLVTRLINRKIFLPIILIYSCFYRIIKFLKIKNVYFTTINFVRVLIIGFIINRFVSKI